MSATVTAQAWSALCDVVAVAEDNAAFFAAVNAARREWVGDGMLTISAYDAERCCLARLWSSDRLAYPVGAIKYKADTPWTRQVLQRGEVFIGEGDAEIAAVFDDHKRIRGCGMHAILNVPLVWRRRCVGTFNVLRSQERWAADEIVYLRVLAQLTVPAVLAW
ncbi:MAG: GAF domain-containing protein [Pseudomonadota bacterium]|nr:GAF domain-containing protein [Pseudomonadota bacterium]